VHRLKKEAQDARKSDLFLLKMGAGWIIMLFLNGKLTEDIGLFTKRLVYVAKITDNVKFTHH
jgi:hypothetical protein